MYRNEPKEDLDNDSMFEEQPSGTAPEDFKLCKIEITDHGYFNNKHYLSYSADEVVGLTDFDFDPKYNEIYTLERHEDDDGDSRSKVSFVNLNDMKKVKTSTDFNAVNSIMVL